MWILNLISMIGRALARGLVRWLAMMGENPPLSRDPGLLCWRYLHEPRDEHPAVHQDPLRQEVSGPLGWTPPGPVRPSLHLFA